MPDPDLHTGFYVVRFATIASILRFLPFYSHFLLFISKVVILLLLDG